LIDANREFVTSYTDVYENFLRGLIDEDAPTLFHCTAGKIELVLPQQLHLLLWGVSKEDVIEDYMKTNAFTKDRIEEILGQIELMSLYQTDAEDFAPFNRC